MARPNELAVYRAGANRYAPLKFLSNFLPWRCRYYILDLFQTAKTRNSGTLLTELTNYYRYSSEIEGPLS